MAGPGLWRERSSARWAYILSPALPVLPDASWALTMPCNNNTVEIDQCRFSWPQRILRSDYLFECIYQFSEETSSVASLSHTII